MSDAAPTTCRICHPAPRIVAAAWLTVRLMLRAPDEPPVTSSTGRSGSRPNSAKPAARSARRSSRSISRRRGIPTTRECGSFVFENVTPTWRVRTAAIRFARPGFAFCSCTTIGVPVRFAAM